MPDKILIVGGDSEIAAATAAHLRASGYGVAATTRRQDRIAADRPFLDLGGPVGDWPIPDGVGAACLCAAIAPAERRALVAERQQFYVAGKYNELRMR